MADLDDFFAKKDRKKAKGKKFTTTDELAKKLEETGKRVEVNKTKPKEKLGNSEDEENTQVQEDDEWKEFEEEKKDYSGLKIGNLTVSENVNTESDTERGNNDNCVENEPTDSGKISGPWKKTDQPPEPEPQQQPQQQQQPTATVGGAYKAPHMRNVQASAPSRLRSIRNVAPDINNQEYFPTLNSKQASNDNSGPWGRRKRDEGNFEEVRNRGGSRTYNAQEPHAQTAKLALDNKYGALSQDQS